MFDAGGDAVSAAEGSASREVLVAEAAAGEGGAE